MTLLGNKQDSSDLMRTTSIISGVSDEETQLKEELQIRVQNFEKNTIIMWTE